MERAAQTQPDPIVPLGRQLIHSGALTEADLAAALGYATSSGLKLGQALIVLGLIDERALAQALARQGRMHCIRLTPKLVDAAVARELGAERARRTGALAINRIAGVTTVAMGDPANEYLVEELESLIGTPVLAVHAEAARIHECIDAVFGRARGSGDDNAPLGWMRAVLDAAAGNQAIALLIDPRDEQVHVHAALPGMRLAIRMPPRACAASIDGLLMLAGASAGARSAMAAAITSNDPTTSSR